MWLLASVALSAASPIAPNGLPVSDTNLPEAVARMFEHAIKVAPHVWALHAPMSSGMSPLANEMVVEQRDGLVLIDAGKTRGAGKRIVALIRSISAKPVKAVILTHWHQDHVLGLGPVVEAWPAARIIASAATAKSIATDPSYAGSPTALDATAARDEARAAAFRQYAKDFFAKIHDASLTPEQHEGWAEMVGVLDQRAIDEKGTYLVLPTTTFTGRFSMDDAEAPIEAIEIGQGHTDSDVVVWAPKQKVLAAGDLVVSLVPYGGNHVIKWPSALDRMTALQPRTIIPGHGDVLHGTAYLQVMRSVIAGIDQRVRALPLKPVLSDDAVRQRIDVSAERRLVTHGDPWLGDLFDHNFADDRVQAYHELTGQKP